MNIAIAFLLGLATTLGGWIGYTEYTEEHEAVGTAAFVFTSGQVGTGATADYILSTNGATSTWIENTGGGGSDLNALSDVTLTGTSTGDILYNDATGQFVNLGAGSNGQVLKLSLGIPSWSADLTGSGLFATNTPSTIIYPVDTTDVLVLGNNATSSNWTDEILNVTGTSLFTGLNKFESGFISQASSTFAHDVSFASTTEFTAITAPAHKAGRLFYDTDSDTLAFYNAEPDVTLNVGEENWVTARNTTGSTIVDGSPVYLTGGSAGNKSLIALARSNATTTGAVFGITTHSIENNTNGRVTTFGIVNNLDTSAFTEGDFLYTSSTVPGVLTNVAPPAPAFPIRIGQVLRSHATQGSIHVIAGPTDVTDGMVIQDLTVNNLLTVSGETKSNYFSGTATTGNGTSTFDHRVQIGTTTATLAADLYIENEVSTDISLYIRESAGQTADIVQIVDSSVNDLFKIRSNGEVDIIHTSVATGERGLEVVCDASTLGNTICQQIDFTVGAIGATDEEVAQAINLEGSASLGGDIIGTTYSKTAGGLANFKAIYVAPELDVFNQDVGTFSDVDYALTYDDSLGTYATVTTQFNSTASDVTLWAEDNDIVYIGGSTAFSDISFIFDTVASKDLQFTFAYSTTGDTFTTFAPVDDTDGGLRSNTIIIDTELLSDWVAGSVNGESQFWVRITRTRNGAVIVPIEDKIQIAKNTTRYYWDKNGDILARNATTTSATSTNFFATNLAWTNLLSSIDLTTDITGTLPVANGGTGITSLGANIATWWGTPSSANLASALTDETGTGVSVFGTAPTFTTNITVTGGGVIDAGGIDLDTGNAYEINNTSVLTATTLGAAVVNSSLTNVGTLTSLTVSGAVIASDGSLEIPNGADPTVNATGEIAIETASNTVRYYDGSEERVIYPYDVFRVANVASTSVLIRSDTSYGTATGTLLIGAYKNPVTVDNLYCKTDVGTVTVDIGDGSASSSLAVTTAGVNLDLSSNNTFNAREEIIMAIGSSASSADGLFCQLEIKLTP